MMQFIRRTLTVLSLRGLAAGRSRSPSNRNAPKIPEKYKWNLSRDLSERRAWRAAKDKLAAEIAELRAVQGQARLVGRRRWPTRSSWQPRSTRSCHALYVYASMLADQDTRVATYQGMQQEMEQLGADVRRRRPSFIEPEILKIDQATIEKFIASEPRLKVYRFYLDDILRRARAHADATPRRSCSPTPVRCAGAPSNIYNILSNADFPYPTRHARATARRVKLDQAGFSRLRALPNRADREKVMSAFFSALGTFSRTFGTTMNGEVQKVLFYAKARKYRRALERALDGPNIPTSVYTRLIDGVNRNLPTFHRYLKLRKRMMGVDRAALLRPLRAAGRRRSNLDYTPEEAQKHVLGGARAARRRLQRRDRSAPSTSAGSICYPNEGKRSGAYSNGGAYDVHPYMLINYNGKYNDVSTLAHELGHTMQSYFSNKTQPYPLADYPIFVAEVASTFNEALLIDYMLKTIKDDDDAAVAARQLPREHQGHGVPADAVRRVRAADARDGARRASRSPATRSPSCTCDITQASTTATTRASASSTTTSRTSGATSRTSTATSTSSSTRRRSPRRRRCPRRCRPAIRRRRSAT